MIAAAMPELLYDAIGSYAAHRSRTIATPTISPANSRNKLRVYNRQGKHYKICPSMIKRVAIGNRSAFYCPTCQKSSICLNLTPRSGMVKMHHDQLPR